jgi:hypothetical protein
MSPSNDSGSHGQSWWTNEAKELIKADQNSSIMGRKTRAKTILRIQGPEAYWAPEPCDECKAAGEGCRVTGKNKRCSYCIFLSQDHACSLAHRNRQKRN